MNKRAVGAGIDTLILFIAMVLVAAIAAAVLILTSNSMQMKSAAVGSKARTEVATSVDVREIYGVDAGDDGDIDYVFIHLEIAAGGEGMKLDELFVKVNQLSSESVYHYKGERECNEAGALDAGTSEYNLEFLQNGSTHKAGYFQNGDHILLCFEADGDLLTASEFRVSIVPSKGNVLNIITHIPNVITSHFVTIHP
jgi:archaellin